MEDKLAFERELLPGAGVHTVDLKLKVCHGADVRPPGAPQSLSLLLQLGEEVHEELMGVL